jgi:hypothetical protein
MTDDNVIDIAAHRPAAPEHPAPPRGPRNADRSEEAMETLEKLRSTSRIPKNDRPIIVRNLGRLLIDIDPESPKQLAKNVLLSQWEKRKRYIRFPNDPVRASALYAASGLEFAGIIERLAQERIRRGFDRAQATAAAVYTVLKDTSFRRPSRFEIRKGSNEDEAEHLIRAMRQVFDKLAQEVELAAHFERVSKYPIYPNCPYDESSNSLSLDGKYSGNDIYDWDTLTDEDEYDLYRYIPWWAPRCVIGHLYISFKNDCLRLPEQGVTALKQACGGEIAKYTWRNKYSELLQPFMTPEFIRPRSVHYRFPVLLVSLPTQNRLVPCLYAATSHPNGFQQDEHACVSQDNPLMPCIVDSIGDSIDDDHKFFFDICISPETTHFICAVESEVLIMSSEIGGFNEEFTPDMWLASSIDELPDWLQLLPVQRVLKLTPDSDLAMHFALSQRNFPKRWRWSEEFETVFRPSFPEPGMFTQLPPNTIGAYLLGNLAEDGGIYEALKSDALEKITATKTVIDTELKKSQDAFDKLYEAYHNPTA